MAVLDVAMMPGNCVGPLFLLGCPSCVLTMSAVFLACMLCCGLAPVVVSYNSLLGTSLVVVGLNSMKHCIFLGA